jgi:hypothetical protein
MCGLVGIYGVWHSRSEALVAHMIFIVLSCVKNAGVAYLTFGAESFDIHAILFISSAISGAVMVEPVSFYCSYYLYSSLNATLAFRR